MLTNLSLEATARLLCTYYTLISWFAPTWVMVFSGFNYGKPQTVVLPKTKGALLRMFKVFRSKRI